jgi:hypothetical protein
MRAVNPKRLLARLASAAVVVVLSATAAAAAPAVAVAPATTSVLPGESFSVTVAVSDVTDAYAFQFDVTYDPTLLKLTSVANGGFLPDARFSGGITNADGSVTFVYNLLTGPVAGVSGGGTLTTLTFETFADRFGSSPIHVGNVVFVDSKGVDIAGTTVTDGSASYSDVVAPTTTASAAPAPNANGWNDSNVTVSLHASDSGSGVKQIEYSLTGAASGGAIVAGDSADVLVTEGISALGYFATDEAGNVETAHTLTVKVDRTPPTIVATANPAANAAGWQRSPVTVSFACADNLALASCSPAVQLGTEGAPQIVAGIATDLAGHATSTSLVVNLDLTPAEVAFEFDPAAKDLRPVVLDALSGAAPIAPASVVPIRWSGDDGDDDDRGHGDGDHDRDDHGRDGDRDDHDDHDRHGTNAERRTYVLRDVAGNATTLVVDVKKDGHELQARLRSLGYLDGAKKPLETNLLRYEWSLSRAGVLQSLSQDVSIGRGRNRRETKADYDARRNRTVIRVEPDEQGDCDDRRHAHRGSTETRPGLVLLRTQTAKGKLEIVL